jgi:mitogen-activated protein kinase kinase kinase
VNEDGRGNDHDDVHIHQGLGSLLDGENSDDEDISMSRNSTKAGPYDHKWEPDEVVEPANEDERERLEWQAMLTSVLDGDVLKSEKTRIAIALEAFSNDRHHSHNKDIWLGLRANLRGVSEKEERRTLEERRTRYVDTLIHDVLEFRVLDQSDEASSSPTQRAMKQVGLILRRLDAIEDLYPTLRALYTDKPLFVEPEFQERRDALLTWVNVATALWHNINSLQKWTGSSILDVSQPFPILESPISSPTTKPAVGTTFVERLLKEDSMQRMFEKKSLTTLHSFLVTTRACLVSHAEIFRKLNLPTFREELVQLISFPSQLVQAILRVRLDYALKVKDPEALIIDQMIDDFRIAIGLACAIRTEYESHVRPDSAGGWNLPQCISEDYDSTILQAVKFLFRLLNWKLKVTPVEEVDVMELHGALFDEVSVKLTDGSSVVAEELW